MKLTIDPNQQKLVLPLVVVLVAAVTITIMRMRAQGPVRPAVAAAVSATTHASPTKSSPASPAGVVKEEDIGRNPFDHPFLHGADGMPQGSARPVNPLAAPAPVQVSVSSGNALATQQPHPESSGLQPLPSTADHTTGSQAQPAAGPGQSTAPANQPAQPQYTLNAVVHGPKGWMAVISCGDGSVHAVSEGGLLDATCRVKKIGQGLAVLSINGKPATLHMPGEGSEVSGG